MALQIYQVLRDRWFIILPVCTGVCVTAIAGQRLNTLIPRDTNSHLWTELIRKTNETLNMTNTLHQIIFLMTLHFLQLLMMFPFMHVTKVLYGFWLGPVWGWLLCCGWELTLIFGYLSKIQSNPLQEITDIVTEAREKGVLFAELVALALSSVPLQIEACLLEFGGVKVKEFWTASMLVTCIMSFKNTICGYLISTSFSAKYFALIASIVSLSTIIPTISTMYVSSKTMYRCIQIYRSRNLSTGEITEELLSEKKEDSIIPHGICTGRGPRD